MLITSLIYCWLGKLTLRFCQQNVKIITDRTLLPTSSFKIFHSTKTPPKLPQKSLKKVISLYISVFCYVYLECGNRLRVFWNHNDLPSILEWAYSTHKVPGIDVQRLLCSESYYKLGKTCSSISLFLDLKFSRSISVEWQITVEDIFSFF